MAGKRKVSEFSNGPGTERQSVAQDKGASNDGVGDVGWADTVRLRAVDPMDADTAPEQVEFPLGTGNQVPS